MKKVLLKVFPKMDPGITQREMIEKVAQHVPKAVFPAKTFMWWAKCVQLDMESKGELVRDEKVKPLRWKLSR